MKKLQHWPKHSSQTLFESPIIKLEVHKAENPRNGNIGDYYKTKFPDWVNVIALTQENEIILIKQYRHGSESIETEIPGGCIAPGETPEKAAVRELLEETGYSGNSIKSLGRTKPNPSIQDNYCHCILIENCKKVSQQQLDHGEDIEVFTIPFKTISTLIKNNEINHSMILSAFHFLFLHAPHLYK